MAFSTPTCRSIVSMPGIMPSTPARKLSVSSRPARPLKTFMRPPSASITAPTVTALLSAFTTRRWDACVEWQRGAVGGRQADAEKFRRVLDADRAIDRVGDGAEEAIRSAPEAGRARRLQDEPGEPRPRSREAGALDHVRDVAVGDRDRDRQAPGDGVDHPFDSAAALVRGRACATSVPSPRTAIPDAPRCHRRLDLTRERHRAAARRPRRKRRRASGRCRRFQRRVDCASLTRAIVLCDGS